MLEIQSVQHPLWKRIFISPNEPRLRAGWRLLIQTIILAMLVIVFSVAFELLRTIVPVFPRGFLVSQVTELIVFTLSIFLARWLLDRRSITSLGLALNRRVLLDIFVGILMMFVLFVFIYSVMSLAGWVKFEGFAWQNESPVYIITELLVVFVVFILVGWNEELLSRGYHLQTLASGLNLTWGVIISSLVFGILHLGNPNATWASAVGIFFAGIFLAYGYIRTKQLWLPISLHVGWNFFEGPIFGFPVSGLDTFRLTYTTVSGPEILTGGMFGPEAGLIVLPALALGTVLIYLYTHLLPPKEI